MTENKAIEWLRAISATQNQSSHSASLSDRKEALYMAIQALEKQSMVNEILHELREYSAIGTIEEFKALKEKSVAKKPKSNKVIVSHDSYAYCPHCKHCIELFKPSHCDRCGGELDWQ